MMPSGMKLQGLLQRLHTGGGVSLYTTKDHNQNTNTTGSGSHQSALIRLIYNLLRILDRPVIYFEKP